MRGRKSVVSLLVCLALAFGLILPQGLASAKSEPGATWRPVHPDNIQIGRSYLIVSEGRALVNEQAIISTPGDVNGDTQIGMAAKSVTIENGLITSGVTPDMIWQFGIGTNSAAPAGGVGEGPGYYLYNTAPGENAGTHPLRRESSFTAQHAPLNTTNGTANGNQQSVMLHVLDENEGTVALYFWTGNNQYNFVLTITEDGFTARSPVADNTTGAQLLEAIEQTPPIRLYEPNVDFGVQHYVIATSGPNGSISPTSPTGHVWVNDGEDVTFTFIPAFGFEVDTVTVNDEAVTVTDNTYTIQNVTSSGTRIHVTFRPASDSAELPFIVYNDIFSVGNITTAVIIDLGQGNTANLSDLSADMFTVSATNTRLDGTTVIFNDTRKIARVYVNDEPKPLGYATPAPGSDDLVTDTPASGRYIIIEFEFWDPVTGPLPGAMASGGLQNAFSTILNYRINVNRELKLSDGTTFTPKFVQDGVVNPALDKFVPDQTNPNGPGNMQILISIDESWKELGPLPLFIYNHGGGRGGPDNDPFAPVQTANGAAVLSKLQLQYPGKYNAHIIATQNHESTQANNEALINYVKKLADEGMVDLDRIYMSGFSMGSLYTIGFYTRYPEFLAAIVPLAGGNLPSAAQLAANPELAKTAIWAHVHKNDGAGNAWTQYFSTGAGASGLFENANVNILETNQAFNYPYFGFDWTAHETEAQVFSNLLGQSNTSYRYGPSQEAFADKNIFDWMFAQSRKSVSAAAVLSGPANAQFGDTFDVTYGLEGLKQDVYAQDITIEYDAGKLELVGDPVSLLDGFAIAGTDIDHEEGIIRILAAHLNDDVAKNPNQSLFKLRFKAKNTAGAAEIKVAEVVVADGEGEETEIGGDAIAVELYKPFIPGDVNDDSRVSVGDLALVAKAYGKTSASPDWDQVKHYDINNDGVIDIEDLVALARLILNT